MPPVAESTPGLALLVAVARKIAEERKLADEILSPVTSVFRVVNALSFLLSVVRRFVIAVIPTRSRPVRPVIRAP